MWEFNPPDFLCAGQMTTPCSPIALYYIPRILFNTFFTKIRNELTNDVNVNMKNIMDKQIPAIGVRIVNNDVSIGKITGLVDIVILVLSVVIIFSL